MTISFGRRLCRHIFFPLALLLYAALPPQSTQAARQIAAAQIQEALSAKPFLEWTLDPGGKLGIQEISSPEQQNSFASLDTHFPPHQSGTLWLRFTLGQRALESRPATLLLDMSSVPGTPLLFIPKNSPFTTTMEWQDTQPSRQSIFLLPEAQSSPQTMYIRLEGLPGPWFAPMLRTPHNAATSWERMVHPAILVALSVIMLLCLLRGLTERGQWRIWTCLYTGATLAHAAYGMPATPDGIVPIHELPGVLAPGIALMLLPHVGRHLMQTRDKARGLDAQYMLLSLPGAALALLPLVPGFAWTSYYLALWPLATALFIPTSLGAWLSGLPGARRFLLACLASIIGGTAGVLGMYVFASSPFFPAGPLLGVGLGALFIAGTAIPRDYERESRPETAAAQTPLTLEEAGLRLVTPEEMSEAAPPSAETPSQPTPPPQFLTVRDEERHASLEGRLRPHLDSLLRESAGIAMCALPPAARQHAEAMANSGRAMASLLNNSASDMLLDRGPAHTVFNLPQLLCEAHNQLAGEAERKGLRISWFMPPHLPQYYLGNVKGIAQVIRLLMESSIRATQQGFVQLAVRRVPESVNPGHLLFSISDSGSGMPPHTRSSLALARAWELTGIQGGSMSAESDARGATITFTLQLKTQPAPQMEMDAMMQTGRVLIIDELSSNRQLLAFLLEGLPCSVEEARNIEDAVQTCRKERAALLLIDCDMPEAENLDTLKMFLAWEHERELPATPVLAIESEGGAWNGLSSFENVHRLVKPVTRDGLRKKVSEILQQHVVSPAPGTDSTRHENGAPDVELPLDLPQPVEYGPSFAPAGEQFIPLSLDQNLSLTATPEPRAGRV
ncbi:MAG: response regulator, partial [Betaproteobacteria bacterium]|nr:response regulator [Betaproteobacteria bacterium]